MKQNLRALFLFSFLLLTVQLSFAQEKEIKGTVTAKADGEPTPGVNVLVKGTTNGTQTDFDGNYSINASKGDVLTFSFLGMTSVDVVVGDSNTINVQLEEDAEQLDAVIVTALGVKKSRKSLTYAAQDINADELNKAKQTNPVNSLSGKVSGVAITRSASGSGGSVKVVLRGNSSLGNNQPLYVVDGIPLLNPTGGQPSDTFGDINGGNRDGGDALSLINPDDIESLTVLKGASASALYGSAGLNGVILITTKKGRAGNFKVDFSSNLTVDSAAYFMDFNGETERNVDDFFDNGITNINSINVSGGTDKAQTYFSYSNTNSSGILPTNTLTQHTLNIRETAQLFNDRLNINANVLVSSQKIKNRPVSGLYFNPLVGAYGFESDTERLSDYSNFEAYDPDRNIQAQRWFRATSDIEQNPYWILHRNPSLDNNKKLVTSLNLKYKFNDWLSLQARGTYDKSILDYEKRVFATTEATLAPENGRYITSNQDFTQVFGDIIATITPTINDDITLTALVGASTTRNRTELFNADSGTNGGLQFANVFSYQNFEGNPQVSFVQNSYRTQGYSLFSSTTLGYKNKVYLDITARNDWTSTLPEANNSFFYPSFGITGILSELFNLGDKVSFAKLRTSYAEVGNGFGADLIARNRSIIFGGGGISSTEPINPFPGTLPEPERQRSFEIGTEWRFNDNKYGIELGYYRTSTINQYFTVNVAAGAGTSGQANINSGDILNKGVEATVFAIPMETDNFRWKTTVNFASNKNEIIKLIDSSIQGVETLSNFPVSAPGVNTFGSYLVEGGAFGDIYAQVVDRDENGLPIVDTSDGIVIQQQDDDDRVPSLEKVGNANPDFTLGWNNSFQYKNFSLDFLVDGKFGGETVSMTEAVVEGLSNNSARESGNGSVAIVSPDGVTSTLSAQEYYSAAGGRNGFTGEYVYSATNVRLAEFALGYKFKLSDESFFSGIKASLVGNNLFFFYKDAPHDPNISLSTGNALQGVDVLGLPSTRSVGLNINLTF